MIRLRQWLADRKARKAAQFLADRRIERERRLVHEVAQLMRKECGLPPHQVFE